MIMASSLSSEEEIEETKFGVLSLDSQVEDESNKESLFLNLPEEIIVKIFSYISLNELYKTVAVVCKDFFRLTRDPAVRKSLCLTSKMKVHFSNSFLQDSVYLTTLRLRNRNDVNELLQVALKHCKHLRCIEAKFCPSLTSATVKCLKSSPVLPNLESLSLEGTGLCPNPDFTDVWQNLFAMAHNLRYLNLFNCRFLDPQDLLSIGRVCTHLEYLNLEEVTHLCLASLAALILERKETLTTLLLDGEFVTDDVFRHVNKCRKLDTLGISFADSIGSEGTESISQLNRLTSLKLMRAKGLLPIEFITMFSSPKLSKLTSLNLSECALFDDNSLIAVAGTCRSLQELILNWCWELTDRGVEEVILYCSKLEKLSLVGVVRLTESFVIDIDTQLPELKYLSLEQCPNMDDAHLIDIVRHSRVNMQIVNYWGETLMRSNTNPFFPFTLETDSVEVDSV